MRMLMNMRIPHEPFNTLTREKYGIVSYLRFLIHNSQCTLIDIVLRKLELSNHVINHKILGLERYWKFMFGCTLQPPVLGN